MLKIESQQSEANVPPPPIKKEEVQFQWNFLSLGGFKRNLQPELMDSPDVPRLDHQLALAGLSRLNRVSGVARVMYRHLKRELIEHHALGSSDCLRVLDIASGAGDVPIAWAEWARRDGLRLEMTTVDISSFAIEEQQRRASEAGLSMESIQADCLEGLPQGYDLTTNSLFMHHLTDAQASGLLKSMASVSRLGILVCDLERSNLNLALVGFAAHTLSRSPIVHHDGLGSVRGAYTREEFARLARSALGRSMQIRSAFPCRFIAKTSTPALSEALSFL